MVNPRWRKVLADLWGNKLRTLLVVASIAVGVFAIGVIAGTYAIIDQDLDQSYASTNPAQIQMVISPFEPGYVDAIRRVEGVRNVDGRRQFSLQVRLGPTEWDTLTVTAAHDYDKLTTRLFDSKEGTSIPRSRELVLEQKSLAQLGLAIDDTIEIELADGTTRTLPIVGTVHDQSDVYGSILGDLQGFISYDTLEWLYQPTSLNQLHITVVEPADDLDRIRQVADAVTERVEKSGRQVYRTELAVGAEHPLSSIIGALLAILVILGVLVVFLSGSLISNTMSSLLNQHLRQIGVMKLVGARRGQVVGMYMLLIATFGLIALLLTVPLASWGAYELAKFVADIVNFALGEFRIVPLAILFQSLIALLIPPLAGMLPVLKGSKINVQKALSSTGLGDRSTTSGWLDRQLNGIRQMSRPLLISIRNTFRRKSRLVLTLATLTLGGAVFIAVFNSQVALNDKMDQVAKYFGADVNLDFARSYRILEITRIAHSVPGVERVEVWLSTGAELVRDESSVADPLAVIAPPADSSLVDPTLIKGRWIVPGDQNAVVINDAFLEDYPGIRVGDSLQLDIADHKEDWIVVGVFQYTGISDLVAYANYDYVTDLLNIGDHASTYRIVTSDHSLSFQQTVSARLNERFRELGFKVDKVEAGAAFSTSITEVLGILTAVLLVMAILTALVGSIGLTGTMSMNVLERTREIGVMRAIGADNGIVSKLVIVEGALIGLISYVLGAILSFPITFLLSNVISLAIFSSPASFAFTLQGFAIWLVVVLALSFFASLLPARNASRLTIREVLAYE